MNEFLINCAVENRTTITEMKPDPAAMKALLRKREAELQKLIRQMKHDNLHTSSVYRKLEDELNTLKNQLTPEERKD